MFSTIYLHILSDWAVFSAILAQKLDFGLDFGPETGFLGHFLGLNWPDGCDPLKHVLNEIYQF